MANAPASLSAHLISELRALEGRPKITYPYGSTDYPRIERVLKKPKDGWRQDFLTADDQIATAVLVQQQKIEEDNQHVQVYRRYEIIPGPEIASARINERGDLETITLQTVATGATPDSGLLVTSSSVNAQDSLIAQQETATVSSHSALVSREYSDQFFGVRVDRTNTIVAPGSDTLPALTLSTLGANTEQISASKVSKTVITLATGETLPTLIEWRNDTRTGISYKIAKDWVLASSVPSSAPTQTANVITEYKQFDKWFAQRFVTTYPNEAALAALAPRTYPITVSHRFDDLLISAEIVWIYSQSGNGAAFEFNDALRLNIVRGYSGPCNAIVTEYLTYDPDAKKAALETAVPGSTRITKFFPRADTFQAGQYFTSETQAANSLQTYTIPETIRDATPVTTTGGNASGVDGGGVVIETTLPASFPTLTNFLAMQYIVIDVDVKPYIGGLYILSITKIENPHYSA